MTATPSPWYRGPEPTHHLTTAGTLSCGAPAGPDVGVSTATDAVSCPGCVAALSRGATT